MKSDIEEFDLLSKIIPKKIKTNLGDAEASFFTRRKTLCRRVLLNLSIWLVCPVSLQTAH